MSGLRKSTSFNFVSIIQSSTLLENKAFTGLFSFNNTYPATTASAKRSAPIMYNRTSLYRLRNSVNGYKLCVLKGEYAPEIVKNVAFMLRSECTESIFIAGTDYEGKPNLTLMYTDDLVAHGMNASKDIREAAKFINGGGGGQPFFASAGGKNTAGLNDAVNKLIELSTK